MTTSTPSLIEPSGGRQSASDRTAQPPIARLVPHSGVQFVDVELPAAGLAEVLRSFIEHRFAADGRMRTVLMPIGRVGSGDIVWHPVSHRALAPEEILTVSGVAAFEGYLGRWLPIPYLRYLGSGAEGAPAYDAGPENWARIFISATPEELREAERIRVALAFDTRLEPSDRSGERRYLAPNADDAQLGATFKLASSPHDLARFAGRPWLDTWLRQALGSGRSQGRNPFELEHVARYLVLVESLARLAPMPEVRFLDTLSRRWPVPVTDVDLVLDIGAGDTAALLVERGRSGEEDRDAVVTSELVLRKLSKPVTRHDGPIATRVEFAPQPFGEAGLSRKSGRTDAFLWPSLVRIGQEAEELALGASATIGVTGAAALTSLLDDVEPVAEHWRFAADTPDPAVSGPAAAGPLLTHLAEDGTLVGEDANRPPAVRPRFAPASLMTLFLTELLLHAIPAINAVETSEGAPRQSGARRLQRVVVAVPAALPDADRRRLATHVDRAVDLVWRALGWHESGHDGTPQRPRTLLVPGTDIAAQLFAIRAEVASRYGGEPRAMAEAWSAGAAPGALRVATIEIGGASPGAVVVDYAITPAGGVEPVQAVHDRWLETDTAVASALVDAFVRPAIVTALAENGIASPELFLSRVLDTATHRAAPERTLARRLDSKVLRPAAATLLRLARELPEGIATGTRTYTLTFLAETGGGSMLPQSENVGALVLREGGRSFHLGEVVVHVSQRRLDAVIRAATAASIERGAELAARHGCDLVVIGGALAGVPSVREDVVARLPVEPARILTPAAGALSGAAGATAARLATGRVAGLAGAYLAATGQASLGSLASVAGRSAVDVGLPMPRPEVMDNAQSTRLSPAEAPAGPAVSQRMLFTVERAGGGEA